MGMFDRDQPVLTRGDIKSMACIDNRVELIELANDLFCHGTKSFKALVPRTSEQARFLIDTLHFTSVGERRIGIGVWFSCLAGSSGTVDLPGYRQEISYLMDRSRVSFLTDWVRRDGGYDDLWLTLKLLREHY